MDDDVRMAAASGPTDEPTAGERCCGCGCGQAATGSAEPAPACKVIAYRTPSLDCPLKMRRTSLRGLESLSMRLMVVIELLVVVAAASCACHLLSGSIAGLLSLGPLPSRALGGRRLMSSGFGALCPSRHRHEHSAHSSVA